MKSFLVGAFAFFALLLVPAGAGAVDINVTTTADEFGEGPTNCSLREALVAAKDDAAIGGCAPGSGADRILLPSGTYMITRAGAEEDSNATGDFDIAGAGEIEILPAGPTDRVIVDGNGLDRVFDKLGAGQATIRSIRVTGGKLTGIEDGGGIRVTVGNLTLDSVTVDGNESVMQSGGGIAVYAGLTLVNSTLSGNRAGGSGGGFYAPGGSIVQARSTTIVSNFADADGNGSGVGGGFSEAGATSVSFTNVINAGNSAAPPVGNERFNDCSSGPFFFPRYVLQSQLIGPNDCLRAFDPGTNRFAEDARYGPLRYNGGQTPTHNLLPGSIAIGNGGTTAPDTCPPIDQNGVGRNAGSCDIGSTTYVPKPNLSIRNVLPKKKVIRRKRARAIKVVIRNSGEATAERLRVCLRLPKASRKALRFRGRPCRNAGNLAAGAIKRPKIRLAGKPKAKRKAYVVVATVKATGQKQIKRKFRVRVR